MSEGKPKNSFLSHLVSQLPVVATDNGEQPAPKKQRGRPRNSGAVNLKSAALALGMYQRERMTRTIASSLQAASNVSGLGIKTIQRLVTEMQPSGRLESFLFESTGPNSGTVKIAKRPRYPDHRKPITIKSTK